MRDAPAYSSDRFPGDLIASLLAGVIASLLSGPMIWYTARSYLKRAYPGHSELAGAAAFAGLIDGLLIGGAAFIVTFAVRIWRHERRERRRSDFLLQQALEEVTRNPREHP